MTIDEVREAKRILEKEIGEMITLFERDTGVMVIDIKRHRFDISTCQIGAIRDTHLGNITLIMEIQ